MAKASSKAEAVLHEFKKGALHSGKPGAGKGKVVTNKKQAVAIALSEARKAGASIPKRKRRTWRQSDDGMMKW